MAVVYSAVLASEQSVSLKLSVEVAYDNICKQLIHPHPHPEQVDRRATGHEVKWHAPGIRSRTTFILYLTSHGFLQCRSYHLGPVLVFMANKLCNLGALLLADFRRVMQELSEETSRFQGINIASIIWNQLSLNIGGTKP
ncbi:hypothetical protein J6590_045826 [Homalodisca vitripennis]|nr:hypothetical protein J6590_045826 [Homalodisca vitripennis]